MTGDDLGAEFSPDHADLPPPDEDGNRPSWFIAYTERSIPRYLAVVNIASLEHYQP